MARDQGDFERANRCFAEGLALFEQVGDRAVLANHPITMIRDALPSGGRVARPP